MNQMSQQPGFGFGQNMNAQNSGYKPTGYVQSQYKGQLRKNYNPQQQPVIAHFGGYQATDSAMSGGAAGQSFGSAQAFQSQAIQPQAFQSQASQTFQSQSFHAPTTPANSGAGPVNSLYGYQGINNGSQFQFGNTTGTSGMSQQQTGGQQTQSHPVYQATNAREQAGPVNSKFGWQSN